MCNVHLGAGCPRHGVGELGGAVVGIITGPRRDSLGGGRLGAGGMYPGGQRAASLLLLLLLLAPGSEIRGRARAVQVVRPLAVDIPGGHGSGSGSSTGPCLLHADPAREGSCSGAAGLARGAGAAVALGAEDLGG